METMQAVKRFDGVVERLKVTICPDGRLNIPNAEIYLGIKMRTLSQWRFFKLKGPKFVKVGGRVFYFKKALDDWIARGDAVWNE